MKKQLSILLCCSFISGSALSLTWVQKNNFTPGTRYGAFAFSVNLKGYVGSGLIEAGSSFTLVNDMWEYDKTQDTWTQKASLPVGGRISAATFTALNKGYISTGYDLVNYLNDTWSYDPALNLWQQMASFPGDPRYTAASFDVSDYGFVGMGKSGGYYSDFYRYNAASDTWTAISDIPGPTRQSAKGFSIDDYGYVVGGANQPTGYNSKELWRYDPISDIWVQKTDYPGNGSHGLAGFVLSGLGYVGTGTFLGAAPGVAYNDFYSYSPGNDTWTALVNFGGGIRAGAVSMTIGNSGFAGMGTTQIYPLIDYQSDWWTFDNPTGIQEPQNNNNVLVYFDAENNMVINTGSPVNELTHVRVHNSLGQLVSTRELLQNQKEITIKNIDPARGVYYYSLAGISGTTRSGKVLFFN